MLKYRQMEEENKRMIVELWNHYEIHEEKFPRSFVHQFKQWTIEKRTHTHVRLAFWMKTTRAIWNLTQRRRTDVQKNINIWNWIMIGAHACWCMRLRRTNSVAENRNSTMATQSCVRARMCGRVWAAIARPIRILFVWWDFYCLLAIGERTDAATLFSFWVSMQHSVDYGIRARTLATRRKTAGIRDWEKFPLSNCNNCFRCEMYLTVKMDGASVLWRMLSKYYMRKQCWLVAFSRVHCVRGSMRWLLSWSVPYRR